MKTLALTVALATGCMFALATSAASAQGYGTGMHHHTTSGYLGSSNHFTYGDMAYNHAHMQQRGNYMPAATYRSGYRGALDADAVHRAIQCGRPTDRRPLPRHGAARRSRCR